MRKQPMVPDFQMESEALEQYTRMSESERDKWLHINVFGENAPYPNESFDQWWNRYYLNAGHYHNSYADAVSLLNEFGQRKQTMEHTEPPVRMFRHDSGTWQVEFYLDDGAHGYAFGQTFQQAVCFAVAKTVINRKLLTDEGKAWRYGVLFWSSEIEGIPSRQVQIMAEKNAFIMD